MIRMIPSTSAGHAKAYFSDALLKSDYYINDQELQGRLHGKIAERLNLQGAVNKEVFFALCDNKNPNTGKNLTPRTKQDRTTGYDINFHCPKSVSIVHALSKDEHILKAFEESVQETMLEIEMDSKTGVRKGKAYGERDTGELIWADFTHQTARPVEDATPDPHLHSHCFVFNATYDGEEKRFKAGQFREINRNMPYYQARFHKRLADRMQNLGYEIRQTQKSFEIDGVPLKVIDLFSKRTDEIGRVAKEQGITDAKKKSELGARTRSKKQKGLTMDELKTDWRRQIHALENIEEGSNKAVRFAKDKKPEKENAGLTAERCVDYAIKHCFERASVMTDRKLLATAYRHGIGFSVVALQDITNSFHANHNILHVKEKKRMLCTTKEVLQEERKMVQLAVKSQNSLLPIYLHAPELEAQGQQAAAIEHVLTNADGVSIIRGAAGTGKTKMMSEAIDKIKKTGKFVKVLAPTSNASRGVLRDEGFAMADTVASFLSNKESHKLVKGQVIWVDEAGLLGTSDMTGLLEIATANRAKLILSGDTRQHASVARGDALRILNTVGGIKAAGLTKIQRQKDEAFRLAVEDLSKGNIRDGFTKLDDLNSIKDIDPLKPNNDLVDDYVAVIKKKKEALIISPTHKQGEEVTKAVREKLKAMGKIGKKEIKVLQLRNLNMTEAEKSDIRNFREGQVIQFNQNAPGMERGSKWSVYQIENDRVNVKSDEEYYRTLPLYKSSAFDVFEKSEMKLSKGDKIRITKNGFDLDKRRMNNGDVLDVASVSAKGKVTLRNKKSKSTFELNDRFGHLSHAHCITSHASQGKTVDEVFIAQPAATFNATDAKQFYVSVSRAREKATVYTDDRLALLEHASELGDRQSAIELVDQLKTHTDFVVQRERTAPAQPSRQANTKDKDIVKQLPTIDIDHGPGL